MTRGAYIPPTGTGYVITVGATSGWIVTYVGKDRIERICKLDIPWIYAENGAILWPMDWVREQLDEVKARCKPGEFITGGMPGADIMICSSKDWKTGPVIHYPSIYDNLKQFNPLALAAERIGSDGGEKGLSGLAKLFRDSGGANVAPFMSYCQLLAYQRWYPELFTDLEDLVIAPLCDLFTGLLVEFKDFGHEPNMMQDQGLLVEGVRARDYWEDGPPDYSSICSKVTGIPGIGEHIAPYRIYNPGTVLTVGEIYVIPFSHDSPFAGRAARSKRKNVYVLSSGTWHILSFDDNGQVKLEAEVVQRLIEKGVVIEGIDEYRAAVVNSSMAGKLYDHLVKAAGMSFAEAAHAIKANLSHVSSGRYTIPRDELPKAHDEAIAYLLDRFSDLLEAKTALVYSAAEWVFDDMVAIEKAIGIETGETIIVVGGWSENEAFVEVLKSFGLKVETVKNGREATVCGFAANALWALLDLYPDFDTAYEALPELVAV